MENNQISLWDRFVGCLTQKYCCFEGRARRAEYWGFSLFEFIFLIALNVCIYASGDSAMALVFGIIYMLFCLALIVPALGVSVRRLHDIGKSGWNLLWTLVPFVGGIILLVFSCMDSQRGTNQYGPCEKYPEA